MAGSYRHIINPDGTLDTGMTSNEGMIENLGDAYEAIEELYGMVWLLAAATANSGTTTASAAYLVEWARANYKDGFNPEIKRTI